MAQPIELTERTTPNTRGQFTEVQQDEPEEYMQMVPVPRKKPSAWLHITFPTIAILFAVVGLIVDEISDGDAKFINSNAEVDYDCGWNSLKFTYYHKGFTDNQNIKYKNGLCTENMSVFDDQYCQDMQKNGNIWLAFSIIGIILGFISIIAIKWGKSYILFLNGVNMLYFILNILSLLSYSIASFNWLINERCHEIEDHATNDVVLDTKVGLSLAFMFVSSCFACLAVLLSSVNIIHKTMTNNQNIPSTPINT